MTKVADHCPGTSTRESGSCVVYIIIALLYSVLYAMCCWPAVNSNSILCALECISINATRTSNQHVHCYYTDVLIIFALQLTHSRTTTHINHNITHHWCVVANFTTPTVCMAFRLVANMKRWHSAGAGRSQPKSKEWVGIKLRTMPPGY